MDDRRKEWFRQRVESLHHRVTAYDVLRHIGVVLRQITDDRQEQISCPFHGLDKKPSARVYPEEGQSKSHVWCYVCQERWDAIGLWKKHNNFEKFSEALSSLEKMYNLSPPDLPHEIADSADAPNPELEAFKAKLLQCDNRLVSLKYVYQTLGDLPGYLAAGSAIDRIKYRVDKQVWTPKRGLKALDQLLEKIHEKVAKCPVG